MRNLPIFLLCFIFFSCPACAVSMSNQQQIESRIEYLINSMLIKESQSNAFKTLEEMGEEAVPYIVMHMDDRRKLPPRTSISLENKPVNSFEKFRHYKPRLVIDALAAILNQITGKGPEKPDIFNGTESETDRDKVVSYWREHVKQRERSGQPAR